MKATPTALTMALFSSGLLIGTAHAQSMPDLKFSGFGTVAAVHSSEKNADFIGTQFQPNGAGHTTSTSLNTDSKLGGQVSAIFNDKLSAVVQVITQHQYDNSYTPQIEWANVKYQVTSEASVRIGRIAAPSYLLSETRYVGYSYPWVRTPQEPYSVLPVTNNDGIDATWRSQIGGANNTVQAYYGKSTVKFKSGNAKSNPGWGINDTIEIGSLTLRAGYNSLKIDLVNANLVPLFGAMSQLGLAEMQSKYSLTGMSTSAVALGATYDPGDWFVMGEFVSRKGDGFISDTRAWYVSAGYRFGSLTPYVTRSAGKPSIEPETAAGPLNGGINSTLRGFNPEQNTTSLGLRWDAMKNTALKVQFDHIKTGDTSNGHLMPYPGFVQGSSLNLVTVAVDFVF